MIHELPYDDPAALRRRLKISYPIRVDRVIGRGRLPNSRLQAALTPADGSVTVLDRFLSVAHWVWFFEPHLSLALHPRQGRAAASRAAARQMGAAFDLGCADLHRRADGAAVVVGRERLHRRRPGRAANARRRRGDVPLRLAEDVRRGRRQSVGGDAVAALRRLGAGGDPAQRVESGPPARSAGPTRAYSASRSSTSASTTSSISSPGSASSPRSASASRWPSRSRSRSAAPSSASS